ncbi:hypothetical protein PENSPDRAFT_627483 [Peniophora sp. CONT]|nr:hypothetical protein PENSPDRAFT_627483 [Peniophora sp. CONT]
MSPSALGVTWVVLTLTAIPASWLVLIPFSIATGHWWGQTVYGLTVTVMDSVFAIGLIYNMLHMHTSRSFCLAQAIIPSVGAYILSGICICLAASTYSTVFNLKHGPLRHRRNPLEWKSIYLLPVVLWPLSATAALLAASFKHGVTFQSIDHLPCEVAHPLWPRLLGYAGAPFLASVPCLVLSVITAYRITTVSRMRQAPITREEQVARLSPIRITAEERVMNRLERERRTQSLLVLASAHSHEKHTDRISVVSLPHSMSDSAWLPSPPTVHDAAVSDISHILPESCSGLQRYSSHLEPSYALPSPLVREGASTPPSPITFAPVNQTPAASSRPSFDPTTLHYYDGLDPMPVSPFDYDEDVSSPANTEQELVVHRVHRRALQPQTDRVGSKDEMSSYDGWPPMLAGIRRARSGSLIPSSELTGALRRILFFQVAFSCIVILAGLTTWIDLAKHRDMPTPFGTQHVALVLVGWGPYFVFGHLPAVGSYLSRPFRRRRQP